MERRKLSTCLKCALCWECCSPLGEVQGEVLGNVILLLAMTVSFLAFLQPEMYSVARSLPCCRDANGTALDGCDEAPGHVAILRLSLAYVLFFLLSFIAVATLRKSEPCVRFWKRGLWLAKATVLVASSIAAMHIKPRTFDRAWTVVLGLGSAAFLVAQVYTLVRASYVLSVLLHRMAEGGSKTAERIQVCLFVLGIVLPVIGEGLVVYYYPLCGMNIVFLVTNAAIPFLACLWSVSDCVKAVNGYSGFFQGGILAFLVVIYTWSAFTNNPSRTCNPYFGSGGVELLSIPHILSVVYAFCIYIINTTFSYRLKVDDPDNPSPRKGDDRGVAAPCNGGSEESPDGSMTRVYNRVFCRFLEVPMICFIAMTVMNWCPVSASVDIARTSRDAMWFKLVGCWASVVFFVVTLYIPSVYGVEKKTLLEKN